MLVDKNVTIKNICCTFLVPISFQNNDEKLENLKTLPIFRGYRLLWSDHF